MQTTDPKPGSPGASAAELALPTRTQRSIGSGTRRRSIAHRARFEALASLLGDDAPVVRDAVRREYESAGRMGLPSLRRVSKGDAPVPRGRARTLLLDREKTLALRRLLRYVSTGEIDLEKALFLLARYHDPRLDPRPAQAKLDAMAREVATRARGLADPLDRAHVLVAHLGRKLGYGGSAGDFHHPDNVHIQRVLETRRGIPLALCALYMFVGERAGIRATCVPLPGHVMLRLHGDAQSRIVDPYHHGQVRTEKDCRRYLEQNGLTVKGAWFRDADDATLLRRQVANLVRSAELRGLPRERRELALVGRLLEARTQSGARAGGAKGRG
jgi:regulator of sirC expression with transglutaminase-like and TPR domain